LRKKKGSYSGVFKAVEEKILCLKFNLGPAVNPTGRLHPEKYICLGHKHLAPGNRFAWKKGSYSAVFKAVEGKILCLKFNLGAGCQSYRKIASRKIYQSGA
jgi:hypothetical protein